MGIFAVLAGIAGWTIADISGGWWFGPQIPMEKQAEYMADVWAHSASYFVGFVGGLVLVGLVWRSRVRLPQPNPSDARYP